MSAELWPHQEQAVGSVLDVIGRGGRTSLIAACGTGKTRIGAAVSDRLGRSCRVLVVVPTIELLVQTLEAYRLVRGHTAGAAVAVCSDPTVAELELLDGEPDVVVTTTPEVLAGAVASRSAVTVLSTYASLPVVAAAHARFGVAGWDVAVVDEAHRTTGQADGPWKQVHHDASIPAARRLYMTATPRVSVGGSGGDAMVSMDDRSVFGPVCYRLPFSKAINMGLLADYRVVVPVVTDDEVRKLVADETMALRLGAASLQPTVVAGQIAVLRTMTEFGVRRAISYHHRVADARIWASSLPATAALMPGAPAGLWAGHVSGAQAPRLRRRLLERLADPGDGLAVIANARVLNEGVDVPAVDAVVFSRPRRSAIDTIQAVGRALRTGGRTDKTATVVVPLLLATGERPEAALEGSEWEPVWQVLRALRDHDDRLDEQLRVLRTGLGEGRMFEVLSREHKLPAWLTVSGIEVPEAFADAIMIRAVRATTPSWDEYFGAARAWIRARGDTNVPGDTVTAEGLALGDWWRRQRVAYNAGTLDADRVASLEDLGMVWDLLEENWMATYTEVAALAAAQGHFAFGPEVQTSTGVSVLNWCSAQRTRRRGGKVATSRIALLDRVGFPWDAAADRWLRRYAELKAIHDKRGTLLRLPASSKEAVWLENQRIANKSNALKPWQTRLIADLGIDFGDRREALWTNTYHALRAFHAEEGHWSVPANLVTVDGVNLSSWCGAQRTRRARGELSAERVALLERIGFPWDAYAERWAARFADLERFRAAHGHISAPRGQLRSWLYQQRKRAADGRIKDGESAKLDALDPLWRDERASLTSDRTRAFYRLTDASWDRVQPHLLERGGSIWSSADPRAVVEAVLWKLGTGADWSDIPSGLGSHVTVSGWYHQWLRDGTWQKIAHDAQVVGGAHRGPYPA